MEDARKTGLKNGLRQLTVEQLQKILYYPDEMVLDSFNYEDGKFCPLAIALDLDKQIVEPTHNIVFDFLTKLGFKVYNTRGISGEFYTTNRKEDLLIAVNEVLTEKIKNDILEGTKFLVRNHQRLDPDTTEAWLSPHPTAIHVIEVTSSISTDGEVWPFRFAANPQYHAYWESIIILLSVEEWQWVKSGKLPLPWNKDFLVKIL